MGSCMHKNVLRSIAAAGAFALGCSASPAVADGTADVYQRSIIPGANDAIKSVMSLPKPQKTSPTVAQAPPVSQQPIKHPSKCPASD